LMVRRRGSANHRGMVQRPPIRVKESCSMVLPFKVTGPLDSESRRLSLGEPARAAVVTVPLSSSSREHESGGSVGRGINGGDPPPFVWRWGGSRLCRESPQSRRYVRERDDELSGTVTTLLGELRGRAASASRPKASIWSLDASGGPLARFVEVGGRWGWADASRDTRDGAQRRQAGRAKRAPRLESLTLENRASKYKALRVVDQH
jgi:hypothetical protein